MLAKKKALIKKKANLKILYLLGLLLGVSSALPAYIQSSSLERFVDVKMVGLFFLLANALAVSTILFFPGAIKKLGNYATTRINIILYITSLFGLALSSGPIISFLSLILLTVSSNLIWINMDVLVESFSSDASTGETRTIYFTFINAGWILAPALSAYLVRVGGFSLSFLAAGLIAIPFCLIFLFAGQKLKDNIHYQKGSTITLIKRMWRGHNLRGIFMISLLLQIFYSSAVVYVPLHLIQNLHMNWSDLGLIFSLMLLPFIILEIPAGIIADKYIGEKEMLFTGIIILMLSTFLFFYIESVSIVIWGTVLFISRIGAALIEAMKETYFFKIIDAEDVGYINIFRTTAPLGYIIGSIIAIVTLFFLPLQYLFLCLSILMISGLFFTASIKDTK